MIFFFRKKKIKIHCTIIQVYARRFIAEPFLSLDFFMFKVSSSLATHCSALYHAWCAVNLIVEASRLWEKLSKTRRTIAQTRLKSVKIARLQYVDLEVHSNTVVLLSEIRDHECGNKKNIEKSWNSWAAIKAEGKSLFLEEITISEGKRRTQHTRMSRFAKTQDGCIQILYVCY